MGSGCCYIVLDDEEVVRETHSGDGLELEIQTLRSLLIQNVSVALLRSLVAQMAEEGYRMTELLTTVVALFVAPARVNDTLVFFQLIVNVSEEFRINLEFRKHVASVNGIVLYLVADFQSIRDDFRMVWEQCCHLLFTLQVFLLCVPEPIDIINISIGSQTDKPVMSRSVLLSYEVGVVCCDNLYAMLLGEVEDDFVVLFLFFIDLKGKSRNFGLVKHDLQVVIVPENALVPLYRFLCTCYVSIQNHSRDFTRHTC